MPGLQPTEILMRQVHDALMAGELLCKSINCQSPAWQDCMQEP
jgi:hypothetical protein